MEQAADDLELLRRRAVELDDAPTPLLATLTRGLSTVRDRWLTHLRRVAEWCRLDDGPTWREPGTLVPVDLGTTGLVAVLQALAAERVLLTSWSTSEPGRVEDHDRVDEIDRIVADLAGRVIQLERAEPGAMATVLDRLDPYMAAVLLGHLGLRGTELAVAAERLLRRWHAGPPSDDGRQVWTDRALAGPDAGDFVAERLARDPVAARELVLRTVTDPEVLFEAVVSTERLTRLLQVALDPANLDTASAGRVVPVLVAATFQHAQLTRSQTDPECASAQAALAPALAPWLLQFGPRSPDWDWSPDDADRALRSVLADPDGLAALLDAHLVWTDRAAALATSGPDGPDLRGLDEIAAALEQIRLGAADVRLESAEHEAWLVGQVLDVGETLIGFAPLPGGFLAGRLFSYRIHQERRKMEIQLRRLGVIGEEPGRVERELALAGDLDRAATVLAVVGDATSRLVADGRLTADAAAGLTAALPVQPATGCATANVREVLLARLEALGHDVDPGAREALLAVVLTFTTDAGDRRLC